jgi:secreted trypsin-like serine protease
MATGGLPQRTPEASMFHFFAALLLAVSAIACAATPPDTEDPDGSRHRAPIVNGSETSDYPATGMLLMQGQVSCTGTLIAPNKVLTAAHCVEGVQAYELEFGFGPNESQIDSSVQVTDAVTHPNWDSQNLVNDVSVLTLAEDAQVAAGGDEPEHGSRAGSGRS